MFAVSRLLEIGETALSDILNFLRKKIYKCYHFFLDDDRFKSSLTIQLKLMNTGCSISKNK